MPENPTTGTYMKHLGIINGKFLQIYSLYEETFPNFLNPNVPQISPQRNGIKLPFNESFGNWIPSCVQVSSELSLTHVETIH